MVDAINGNTGEEYDVKEVFEPGSDKIYYTLAKAVDGLSEYRDIRDLLSASEDERRRIGVQLKTITGCTRRQIEKFLRL